VGLFGIMVSPLPPIDIETLMVLLTGILGLGGFRTYEKVKKAS
jgi:predicted AlkP superfamily phosphohydrolase/phosphomutase